MLQAKNLALEAQYQYYIDQSYLAQIRSNLEQMTANAELLQRQAGGKYKEDVDMMLDRLTRSRKITAISVSTAAHGDLTARVAYTSSTLKRAVR